MAAVGLSDVFKYGTRFLAHLLVVVLLGVVVVLLGDVVGGFTSGTVTDPGIRSNLGTTAYVGIAISVAGVLVTVAGLGGLVFKLVADGTAVGTRSMLSDADEIDLSTGDASADEQVTDESETSEQAAAAGAASAQGQSSPETTAPGQGESEQTQASQSPEPATAAIQQSSDPTPATQQPNVADSPAQESSQPTEPVDVGGTEQATSSPETEHSPAEPAAETGQHGSDDVQTVDAGQSEPAAETADEQTDEPPEWTPPDPDEFERQQAARADASGRDDGGRDDDRGQADDRRSATGEYGAEQSDFDEHPPADFEDETRVVEGDQFDEQDDGVTTWDDLQSSSGGDSDPANEDQTETRQDDWGAPGQFDDQTTQETAEQSNETSQAEPDETVVTDDDPDDEDSSDDGTAFTFETSGDSDPLSDALGDE